MIICEVNKNHLNVRTKELLTAGSQNVNTVEFRFNAAWDGLAKTATFKTSKKTISVLLNTNTTAIPWEALADAGEILAVGVFGVSGETLVLPTVWGILGKVMDAAHLGDDEKEPTPDVYQKILDELNALERPTWNAVQNKPFSTLGGGLSVDENGVLSAEGGGGGSDNAVQYVAQSLTDEQKKQARENIDADKKRIIYNATRGNYGRVNLFDSVSSQNAAIDKIIAEYKAGTEVIMRLQDRDFPLNQIEENAGEIWFSSYSVTTDAKVNVVTFVLEKDTTAVEENYINGIKTVDIDSTLRISDYAADAKAVGDALDTKLDKNQGTDNAGKILGVGEDGNVIPQDKPTYTLPQATADALGGIKADAATAEDTQDVRIGADGKLKTKPTGGSTVTVDSALSSTSVNPVQNKIITAALAGKITAPTTAAVGQIIKVKSVDDAGKPTEWEAADLGEKVELIASGTIEEVASLVVTKDSDGNTLSLKNCYVVINGALDGVGSTSICFRVADNTSNTVWDRYEIECKLKKDNPTVRATYVAEQGKIPLLYTEYDLSTTAFVTNDTTVQFAIYRNNVTGRAFEPLHHTINKIIVGSNQGNGKLAAGTKYEIYGVRV